MRLAVHALAARWDEASWVGTVAGGGGVGGGGVVEADADLRGWTVAGVGTASVCAFIIALGVGTTGRGKDWVWA